jgi:16S rRNA (uracil1498-N3)-methyltransferase
MRVTRVYYPELLECKGTALLKGHPLQHLSRVLRHKPGDKVILFDGNNHQCEARIDSMGKEQIDLSTQPIELVSRESNLDITLIQGMSRGERMDWTLQKATELGVRRIIPANTRRSIVKLDARRRVTRLQHWQGVLIHACEQSGRNLLPELEQPQDLSDAISLCEDSQLYYLDPLAETTVRQLPDTMNHKKLCLVIGPEGGFDDDEQQMMIARGAHGLKLGPRTLRTETAGIVALAALGALFGDL